MSEAGKGQHDLLNLRDIQPPQQFVLRLHQGSVLRILLLPQLLLWLLFVREHWERSVSRGHFSITGAGITNTCAAFTASRRI